MITRLVGIGMKNNINKKIVLGSFVVAIILLILTLITSYFELEQYQGMVTNLVYIYLIFVIIYIIIRTLQNLKNK